MKLSTKGRYAMIALVDLAIEGQKGLVSLGGIAERQDISLAYLEQLFVKLRRAGLVASVRGPGGGYHLARPASEIRVSDILEAVEVTDWRAVPIPYGSLTSWAPSMKRWMPFQKELGHTVLPVDPGRNL